jgi:pyochelin biosynthesis protein PchC
MVMSKGWSEDRVDNRFRGQDWLRPLRPEHSPMTRLVCFPHAGGSATFFRDWPRRLPPGIDLSGVRYPGREGRYGEPFAGTVEELADQATRALLPLLDVPVAIFGHSMGAAVAYEVAFRLEHDHGVVLRRLFASGQRAPQLIRPQCQDSGDQAVLNRVRKLGSTETKALDDPELRELLLPVLRADFQLMDAYDPAPGRLIGSPVTGLIGDRDPEVPVSHVQAWADATSADFDLRVFPGDHFYLVPGASAVVGAIGSCLAGEPG